MPSRLPGNSSARGHGRGHALDPGDPVAGLGDPPDLLAADGRPEALDVLSEGLGDVVGPDRSSVMSCPFALFVSGLARRPQGLAGLLEAAADAAVEQLVPDPDDH